MAEIENLSTTDASNSGAAANAGFPENMNPSDVNNAARALEGMIARLYADTNGSIVTTGSSNAYVLAAARTISSYAQGQIFMFEANHANTGAATLNVDSVGAKAIVKNNDIALTANDIEAGQIVLVAYEATADNFQMLSQTAIAHMANVITTRGDLIRGSSSAVGERLALGGANTHLSSDGSDAHWVAGPLGTQEIFIAAPALQPTTSNGCGTLESLETTAGRGDIVALPFDGSSDEFCNFSIGLPKQYGLGTATAQFYWSTTHTGTNTCAWTIAARGFSDNDSADQALGTAQSVTDTALGATEKICISSETSALTIGGSIAANDLVTFLVGRDVSEDSMSEDALLLGVKLRITVTVANDS